MRRHNQKGISFVGFLIVAAVAGFFLITGAKLFPAYSEFRGVKESMNQLTRKPGAATIPLQQLWGQLDALFNVAYVSTPKIANMKLDRKNGNTLTCEYEYRTAYVGNIDLAIKFKYAVSLNAPK
jgi:hypothetical protein